MPIAAEEKLGCGAHTELGLRAQAAALEVLPYLDIVCAERLQQNVLNAPSGLRRQQRRALAGCRWLSVSSGNRVRLSRERLAQNGTFQAKNGIF